MLSVNLCGQLIPTKKSALSYLQTNHLFVYKIPNFQKILRIHPFPNSISCLLQPVELNPQTVQDSFDEDDPEEKEEVVELFTVNYLVNACGLSEREAINVAKRLIWENKRLWELIRTENADAALDLLREYGFSRAHISMAVKRHPLILMAPPYDTILPKLDFLRSIGPKQASYLGEIVSQSSQILATSLKRTLIPNYKILKELFGSNHELIHATLKKGLGIMQDDLSRTLVPNVEVLRDAGVSESRIHYLVVNYPLVVRQKHSKFTQAVIQLKEMGFDPSSANFIFWVFARSRGNKDVWDRSFEVFLKLGCSRDEILSAFRKYPFCMLVSKEKINKVIDCLVNEMGWPYDDIVNKPHLFKFSLEKRIIPRCSVVLFLHSKGFLAKLPKLSRTLEVSVNYFINRYVTRYVMEVPQVLQIYKGKQGAYLGEIVSQSSQILATSLKRGSNHELIHATLKKGLGITQDDLSRTVVPNVEVLRDAGVSESRIHYLVVNYPLAVREKHSKIRQAVIQLKELGFDPSRANFMYGVIALSRGNKDSWDRFFEVFLKLGCSRDEIVSAFRKYPLCMLVSEEKIHKMIDCLVNEMGWPYDDIVKKPHLFVFSLEKRIIPRCSVVLFLHSKGFLHKLPKLSSTLAAQVNYFINRYVTRYVVEVPQVLQIFKGELNFLGK